MNIFNFWSIFTFSSCTLLKLAFPFPLSGLTPISTSVHKRPQAGMDEIFGLPRSGQVIAMSACAAPMHSRQTPMQKKRKEVASSSSLFSLRELSLVYDILHVGTFNIGSIILRLSSYLVHSEPYGDHERKHIRQVKISSPKLMTQNHVKIWSFLDTFLFIALTEGVNQKWIV